MMKPTSLSSLVLTGLLLAGSLSAQRGPLMGTPLVPPPVPHPALAGQPLIDNGSGQTNPPPAAAPIVKALQEQAARDPATSGVKVSGGQLKRAVAKVKQMPWHKSYGECLLDAKASGKPVLWLQTLGDLTGFA